jgi:RND family efflux transporter MFP subunit
MIRNIIIAIVAVAAVGFVVFKLRSNKEQIDKAAAYKEVIENVPVSVITATKASVATPLVLTGYFNPYKEVAISAESNGKLTNVYVNEGEYLKQGQTIAAIDATHLALKLELEQAQMQKAKQDLMRFENLNREEATSDITVKQMQLAYTASEIAVKSTKQQIAKCIVKSPINGFLTEKNFENGSMVAMGVPIGRVTDIKTLKFNTLVPEVQVVKFATNQQVFIEADVFPKSKYKGVISMIAMAGDPTHNYKMEVLIKNDNAGFPLKAGMSGILRGNDKNEVAGIFVPRAALVGSTAKPQLYVAQRNKAILKDVKVGVTIGNDIQIVDGIVTGDQVVVAGMNNLENERTIKISKQ